MQRWWRGRPRRRPGALLAGLAAAALIAVGGVALPGAWRSAIHERTLDELLTLATPLRGSAGPATRITVVDIDAASLAKLGPWPWDRGRMAGLVTAASRAGATAVAIDILFEGPDAKSPAALARRLGTALERSDLDTWAETLPDGDRLLAETLGGVPTALGFALDPRGTAAVPGVPMLARGTAALPALWRAPGGVAPFAPLLAHAAGLGALALPGDDDGVVRRVPLLVGVAGRVHPGLAAEAVRLAQGASAYELGGDPAVLGIGDLALRLPADGMLRLVPEAAGGRVATVSAAALLAATDARLRGAIVLIGGSAPELGGLRAAPGDPLMPSVLLHAAAVAQLLRGQVPLPVPHAVWLGAVLGALATAAGLLAGRLRPLRGALAVAGLVVLLAGGALAAAADDRLFDPLETMALAIGSFAATALATAAETQVREARIRRRFAQHLAPAVVELIAADPSVLKLRGERREITALFTDVEGFTAMTHSAAPEAIVAVLDDYFEGVARIVMDHGGLIDKFVGDAVHAFFNTPLDLPDHTLQAVRCAVAIRDWTEKYRRDGLPADLGFGRTRVGIECGPAVVGDIGLSTKLDYTAHGDAVNAAARFEAANKELGSAICVGPQAAARCPPGLLRPTGALRLRGFSDVVRTFEPWPDWTDADWRVRYLDAFVLAEQDPAEAVRRLAELAAGPPGDAVAATLARRFAGGAA